MNGYPYDINECCLIARLTEDLTTLPFSCGDTDGKSHFRHDFASEGS